MLTTNNIVQNAHTYMHDHILITRCLILLCNMLNDLIVFINRLSGLDLPRNTSEPSICLEKVKDKLQELPHSVQNGAGVSSSKADVPEVALPVTESTLQFIAQKQRHK